MDNYILIPSWVLKLKKLEIEIENKHIEVRVTGLMRMFIGLVLGRSLERGFCDATNDYIAEILGCTTRQVQNIIKRLGYAGILYLDEDEISGSRSMMINAEGVL